MSIWQTSLTGSRRLLLRTSGGILVVILAVAVILAIDRMREAGELTH
jgi:hypothetical protein